MHFVPLTAFAVASGTFGTAEGTKRSPPDRKRLKWNEMHPHRRDGSQPPYPAAVDVHRPLNAGTRFA